jgi:hypothetical protein
VDIITKNLLSGFAREYEIEQKSQADQFERLAAFSMIRRHFNRNFDIEDAMMGGGGDTGIDALAIIVNNVLVTEVDTVLELVEQNGQLDVTFIFVQAQSSKSFDGSKIGDFGFGVRDFFSDRPQINRNEEISAASLIMNAVYAEPARLTRRPLCHLYYVTTGKWVNDNDLVARRQQATCDMEALDIFSAVHFSCIDAYELLNAYRQTKNAVTRTFDFKNRNDLPAVEGINQAFIGYIPFLQFKIIISNESGTEMLGSIFDENVRDWQGDNSVNQSMKNTLTSPERSRFVFMNNGVTIIARSIKPVGSKFTISDYQIVNGCQTSNVLFEQREHIGSDDDVFVPLRLIETNNENVMDAIIQATNSQTAVKTEQYFARMEFSRKLESYFNSVEEQYRLYYERRDGQYDRGNEMKTKVISAATVIRAFSAVYLEEPHKTTRGYGTLRARVGRDIFGDGHVLEPYFAASYAYYLLETRFKSKSIRVEYKPARYHILLALRLLVDNEKPSQMNSNNMRKRAENFVSALYEAQQAEDLFVKAIEIVDRATSRNLARDHVRTTGVTNKILKEFGRGSEQ